VGELGVRQKMMNLRATISLSADASDEVDAFESWLETWKDKMTFVSGDYGCGCCVHLFDVEGPQEAISAIPESLRCQSQWTDEGVKSGDSNNDLIPQK